MKKKNEYEIEHVLTIENLKFLIGMFFIGIMLLILSGFMWHFLFTTDCCNVDAANSVCNIPTVIGLIVLFLISLVASILGLICMFGVFLDEGGPEIKVKK